MALPLIPIVLALSALGSGVAGGISSVKNAKSEARALQESTQDKINARAKEAKKLMQEQKTSYLKGGVYFNTDTPIAVINETYDTSMDDINAMIKDTNTQTKNLEREGKTAFFSSLLSGAVNAAASYFGAGGTTGNVSNATSSTNNFRSLWQRLSGNYTGGFGNVIKNSDMIV